MTARAMILLDDDHGGDLGRWSAAGAVVLAAYGAIVGGYLLLHNPQAPGVPAAPAILIDMAPAAAPDQPLDVAPGPEMMEADPPPEPEVREMPPLDPLIELPPPEPMVKTPLVAIPEPPPPEAKPETKPPEPKPPEPKPPEKKPEVRKVERKKPAPRTTAPQRSDRQVADRESAASAGAPSSAAANASWRDQVLSQLQRAKRYPGGAESRREQGVVTLSFTISRGGGVLARGVARSSGYPELDQEVLSMVQRAQPFPSFPVGMNQNSISLTVPIRFSLR